MPIDKLIPRYLNKDDDFLIVKAVEAVDALNIQTSDDEGGNAGVMKNTLGNVVIATGASGDALPSGTNTVIGTAKCKQTGEIFYFVHNSSNNHSVYRYSTATNTTKLVYRDSVLGFTATGFVKGDCMVKENGDVLLYFTDGVTDPKKINATRALANTTGVSGYPYKSAGVSSYTDAEKLLSITTIKAPPPTPPIATVSSDTSITSNNITDKLLQFAYQYVYEDGELSAISPYSEIALNYLNFVDGYVTDDMKRLFNSVLIGFNYSKGDVSKVRILYREGTLNNFSFFKDLPNDRTLSTGSISFTNSIIGNPVSDNEMNKQYDSVPLSAVSQAISGNRLTYGNYKEFYDNTTLSGNISFLHESSAPKLLSFGTETTGTTVTASTTVNSVYFTIDLSDFPDSSSYNTTINASFQVTSDKLTLSSGSPSGSTFSVGRLSGVSSLDLGSPSFNIQKTFVVGAYANKATLASSVIQNLSDATYLAEISPTYPLSVALGTAPTYDQLDYYFAGTLGVTVSGISVVGSVITFRISPNSSALNVQTSQITRISIVGGDPIRQRDVTLSEDPVTFKGITIGGVYNHTWTNLKVFKISSSFGISNNTYTTFKSGQRHRFGIVYYDNYNRSSAVNELGEFYNPNEGDRPNGEVGQSSALLRLSSQPPSWAKKWQLVYSPYMSYSYAYRYSVAEAFVGAEVTGGSSNDKQIYLAMRHLEGKQSSYKESKGAKFDYQYAEGDKLRVVSYVSPNGAGSISYPNEVVFDIVGYEYVSSSGVVNVSGATNKSYRETGDFLIIKSENYSGFSASDVVNQVDLWDNDTIVEIYRPVPQFSSLVYREIGEVMDIGISGGNYYHKGLRDLSYVFPSVNLTALNGTYTITGQVLIYPGDRFTFTQIIAPGGPTPLEASRTVSNSKVNASGHTIISFLDGELANSDWTVQAVSGLSDTIIKTSNGDCYYRPRQIKLNPLVSSSVNVDKTNVSGIRYVNYFVEDLSVSDFFSSNYIGVGRPNAVAPEAKQIERKSSITYSEPYALDSSILKLSSFNGSQGNFVDLPNRYGAIQYIHDNGDSITVLHDVKSSVIPINRNLVEYSDGNANIVVSNNYLGTQSVYIGDYGTQSPESVQVYDGRTYFVDKRAGKAIRISADGIEAISEAGVDAYTQDKCFITVSTSGSYKIIGGIDPQHSEYLVTYVNASGGNSAIRDTIAYDTSDKVWNTRYSFIPEAYEHLDNYMYTFASGSIYRHTDQSTRNNFFGVQASSSVKVISALNNSMVKVANAISIEGDSAPSVVISNKNQSTRAIASGEFQLKEGNYYVDIPRSSGTTGSSNYHAIGIVSASSVVGGNLQLVFSNPINIIPFQTSGTAFITCTTGGVTGTTTYTQATIIDNNTLRFTGNTTAIPVGVIVVNVSDSSTDGDVMRGPFFAIEATFASTQPIEIYAINMHFARSNLANELGNE